MSRVARKYVESEYWHIMLRGIGHMNLFLDDEDYMRFEKTICKYKEELHMPIYAYCLMGNHVHMLVGADTDILKLFFKKVEVSYSYYYNHKYEHVGHLFQNRYKSEPIQDEKYLLSAFKYVLRNPENAGISKWDDYPWSSASQYISHNEYGITDIKFIMGAFREPEEIKRFVSETADVSLAEPENTTFAIKDKEAVAIIAKLIGTDNPMIVQGMQKNVRDAILVSMKQAGLSIRQIERLTGINRNIVQRAT